VLRAGGVADAEAAARAANAEPWEPMPGECRYLFAATVDSEESRRPDSLLFAPSPHLRWRGYRPSACAK
jgi:hypothetical protein